MNKITNDLIDTLNEDQKDSFNEMQENDRLQICLPTGVGKGYLMGVDLRNRLLNGEDVITIASHRLILNTQHMNDLIKRLSDMIGKVRFVFVGSEKYDHSILNKNETIKKILISNSLATDEIIKTCLSQDELSNIVSEELMKGNKVVVVSTYHSMDKLRKLSIDTLYADEAHTLSSNERFQQFEKNYRTLTFKNSYFFTATPRDCTDDNQPDTFLMNNEEVFGKRIGMTMTDAIQKGYITRPIIHLAVPMKYGGLLDMDNVRNKIIFIKQTMENHTKLVKESSAYPDLIEPKLLIKCESVYIMWEIYHKLLNAGGLDGIDLYAGASKKRNHKEGSSYQKNGIELGKKKHLESLIELKDTDKAIVLHVDTLSEGVNVKGFTGIMFLTDKAPSKMKMLQNIGRGTRVLDIDRDRFEKGEINTSDYSGWVKPNTFVILPVYSPESRASQDHIANTVKDIRDNGGSGVYEVSIGNDISTPSQERPESGLNPPDFVDPRKRLVEEIDHQIEELYLNEENYKERMELNRLTKVQLLEEKLGQ
tara:strand:- start:5280 stop:6887 length:1608 start_codon:yes stop_codon:yes gene_type:complete